jgi:hypothetical protein
MFDKNQNTDLLGKTNRIVEGTIIERSITSPPDFRWTGHLLVFSIESS